MTEQIILAHPTEGERTYFVTRVYTDGSGHRTCEAYFYRGVFQREVRNWERLAELARLVDERRENPDGKSNDLL